MHKDNAIVIAGGRVINASVEVQCITLPGKRVMNAGHVTFNHTDVLKLTGLLVHVKDLYTKEKGMQQYT